MKGSKKLAHLKRKYDEIINKRYTKKAIGE